MNNSFSPVGITEGQIMNINGIPVYPIIITLAIIAGIISVAYFWYKESIKWKHFFILVAMTLILGFVGARLWYVFDRLIFFNTDPFPNSSWYAIWDSHFDIQGAVVLAGISNILYIIFHKKELDFSKLFSIILPSILISQAIVVWVFFANHINFGQITDGNGVNWLGTIISNNMFITLTNGGTAFRLPIFFYEFLLYLVGYLIITWIILNFGVLKPGSAGAIYLIYYSIIRLIMYPLFAQITIFYLAVSIIMLAIGLFMIVTFEIIGKNSYDVYKIKWSKYYKIITTKTNVRWLNDTNFWK